MIPNVMLRVSKHAWPARLSQPWQSTFVTTRTVTLSLSKGDGSRKGSILLRIAFLLAMLLPQLGRAQTTIPGSVISSDSTWDIGGSPYTVTGIVEIYGGFQTSATLTIEPGVTVQFNTGTGLRVGRAGYGSNYPGVLVAEGTSANPITFTSSSGDSGGWQGIYFSDGSDYTGLSSSLKHSIVENAGELNYQSTPSAIYFRNTDGHTLDTVTVRSTKGTGVYLYYSSATFKALLDSANTSTGMRLITSSPSISNSRFKDNDGYSMWMDVASRPILSGNTHSGNTNASIRIDGGLIGSNWTWYEDGAPYVISSTLSLRTPNYQTVDDTLTIEPGVTVQFDTGTELQVGYAGNSSYPGVLIAEGTSASPITFTSSGDTTNGWKGIYFADASDYGGASSSLKHAIIENAGQSNYRSTNSGIYFYYTSGHSLDSVTVRSTTGIGVYMHYSSATFTGLVDSANTDLGMYLFNSSSSSITNSRFENNGNYGLRMDVNSRPTLVDNTHSGNTNAGIRIDGGQIASNWTWYEDGAPYVVTSTLSLRTPNYQTVDDTLTIEPGVTVQFNTGTELQVGLAGNSSYPGVLIAEGTSGSPITFTSSSGSTNGWKGIYFSDASDRSGAISSLIYCTVENAGESNYRGAQSGIHFYNAGGHTLDNVTLQNNGGYGITSNSISNFAPTFTNLTLSGNANPGVSTSGGTTTRNVTLGNFGEGFYTILTDITVAGSDTLTVKPGVTLKFAPGARLQVGSGSLNPGRLYAVGKLDSMITFTSTKDTLVGGWEGLYFEDASDFGGFTSILKYCIVEKGGATSVDANINTYNTTQPTMDSLIVRNSGKYGLWFRGTSVPSISNSDIHSHKNLYLYNNTSLNVLAPNNYWGTSDGIEVNARLSGSVTPIPMRTTSVFSGTPLLTPPYSATAAAASDTTITVDWTASSSTAAAKYYLYRDDGYGTVDYATALDSVNHPTAIWTSPALPQGLVYKFGIRAAASDGTTEENFDITAEAPSGGYFVSGIISDDTTWAAGGRPYRFLEGNLTVNADKILTIDPGVTVKFRGNYLLQVDGGLRAIGTEADTIRFTSYAQNPAGGDWYALKFTSSTLQDTNRLEYTIVEYGGSNSTDASTVYASSSKLTVDNSIVRNSSRHGIRMVSGELSVSNTAVYGNANSGVASWNGPLSVTDSDIRDNTQYGIYQSGSGATTVSKSVINANGYRGIYINGSTPLTVQDSTVIKNNSQDGIYTSGPLTLRNSYVQDNTAGNMNYYGIQVRSSYLLQIDSTEITGNAKGLYVYNASAGSIVEHSTISGSAQEGINIRDADVAIDRVTIANNGTGIYTTAAAMLTRNTITGNVTGVKTNSTPRLHFNNLQGNVGYYLETTGSSNVDARFNWWGTTNQTTIAGIIKDQLDDGALGQVDFSASLIDTVRLADTTAPVLAATARAYNGVSKTQTLVDSGRYNFATPHFEWTPATDAYPVAGYSVLFTTDTSAGTIPSDLPDTGDTTYTVSQTLTDGSTYYLKIRAVDNNFNTGNSQTLFSYLYDSAPPSPVTNFSASPDSGGAITLTWTPSITADIQAYYIYFDSGTGTLPGTPIDTLQHPDSSWTSVYLTDSTQYLFGITAVDSSTNEEASITVTNSATADATPPVLVSASGDEGASTLVVNFSEYADSLSAADKNNYSVDGGSLPVDSVRIQGSELQLVISTGGSLYNPYIGTNQNTTVGPWSPSSGGEITRIHIDQSTESCCDELTVYNADNQVVWQNRGTYNQWVDITATTSLSTRLTSDGSVSSSHGDVDSVDVLLAGSDGTTLKLAAGYVLPPSSQLVTVTLNNLRDVPGNPMTTPSSVTFYPVNTPPAQPVGVIARAGLDRVTLSWSPNIEGDLARYVVFQSTTSGFTPAPADSVASVSALDSSVTITSLTTGTAYYYRVLAVDNVGNRSAYSAQVRAVPGAIALVSPSPNELTADRQSSIQVQFAMGISSGTLNSNSFVVHASQTGLVGGVYSYDSGTFTATFVPDAKFKPGEMVAVTLTTGIQTPGGDPLASPYSWSFTVQSPSGSGLFETPVSEVAGDSPRSIFAADLNGDGHLDLATANYYAGTASVLLGNGDGTFAGKVDYSTGSSPWAVMAADFDGDGDLDLVTANFTGDNVSVFLGSGDGTFASRVDYPAVDGPTSVVAADLNGDGILDLTLTNSYSDNISVLMGIGDGTFAGRVDYIGGDSPYSVFAGDLDGDGDLDLATANLNSDNISILIGNGDGTFAGKVDYPAGNGPRVIVAGDMDGDGDLDLVTANYYADNVSVFLGNGDGIFSGKVDYAAGNGPFGASIGDLNADGIFDLITANNISDDSAVLMGNGDGTFAGAVYYSGGDGPWSVVAADLDGDSDLELATVNANSDNISIYFNQAQVDIVAAASSLSFGAVSIGRSAGLTLTIQNAGGQDPLEISGIVTYGSEFSIFPETASIDALESLDFTVTFAPTAVQHYSDSLTISSNDPDEPELTIYLSGTGAPAVLSHDPAANSLGGSNLSSPAATFSNPMVEATLNAATFRAFGSVSGLHTGAYTYDAGTQTATLNPDTSFIFGEQVTVVLTESVLSLPDNIGLARGHSWQFITAPLFGSGVFVADGTSLSTGSAPFATATGDFDRDGFSDLVVVNPDAATVSIFLNDRVGGFGAPTSVAVGTTPQGVAVGDLNADGKPDLVVTNINSATVSVLMGVGDGTVAAAVNYATGAGPRAVAIGDGDNDGFPEIVTGNITDDEISILFNLGDGTFGPVGSIVIGGDPSGVTIVDLDSDGYLDLAVIDKNASKIRLFLSSSESVTGDSTSTTGAGPNALVAYDFDGDGDVDLATANGTDNNVSVLLNDGSGVFGTVASIGAGTQPIALTAHDFDADGDMDLAVLNFGSNDLHLLTNDGSGAFTPSDTVAVGTDPRNLVTLDISGGVGIMDIVVANLTSANLSILRNQVAGDLVAKVTLAEGGEQSADVLFNFNLYEANGDSISILAEYSQAPDSAWQPATVTGDTSRLGRDAYRSTLIWNSATDLPLLSLDSVSFRITAYTSSASIADSTDFFALDNNGPPTVTIDSIPDEKIGDVPVLYTLVDAENDTLSITTEMQIPGTGFWQPATVTGNLTGITIYRDSLVWASDSDLVEFAGDVYLRITPADADVGQADTVTINIDQIGAPRMVSLTIPTGELSDQIELSFTVADEEQDSVDLQLQYSLNDGANWSLGTMTGVTTGLDPSRYSGVCIWESTTDLAGVDNGAVLVRLLPWDGHWGQSLIVGPFHLDNNFAPVVTTSFQYGEYSGNVSIPYLITDQENDEVNLQLQYYSSPRSGWIRASLVSWDTLVVQANYSGSLEWATAADFPFTDQDYIGVRLAVSDLDPGTGDTVQVHLDNETGPVVTSVYPASRSLALWRDTIKVTLSHASRLAASPEISFTGRRFLPSTDAVMLSNTVLAIVPSGPLSSADTLSVSLSAASVTDLNDIPLDGNGNGDPDGSPADDYSWDFYTAILGDYNMDGVVGFADLVIFREAWTSSPRDFRYELAPVAESIPHLRVVPDHRLNLDDLAVLARMWDWSINPSLMLFADGLKKQRSEQDLVELAPRFDDNHWAPASMRQFALEIALQPDISMAGLELKLALDPEVFEYTGFSPLGELAEHQRDWIILDRYDKVTGQLILNLVNLSGTEREERSENLVGSLQLKVLRETDVDVAFEYTISHLEAPLDLTPSLTEARVSTIPPVPAVYALHPNFPNPFNPRTTIRYEVPEITDTYLVVFNLLGQQVLSRKQSGIDPGYYEFIWDGRDAQGRPVASGVYFARLMTPRYSKSIKMVLLK